MLPTRAAILLVMISCVICDSGIELVVKSRFYTEDNLRHSERIKSQATEPLITHTDT